MKVLVLNCGSSSIKYQLFAVGSTSDVLAKGLVERVGLDHATLTHQPKGGEKVKNELPIPSHKEGVQFVLDALLDPKTGVIKDLKEIEAVGHRVAHGGESFSQSVLLNNEVIAKLVACSDLAPLHNPANLKGVESITAVLPNVPQVAVFDTAFHQTMPDYSYLYALPYEYYEKYSIRRYGFHGTSHRYVAQKACDMVGVDIKSQRIISCHLGNGASICAVDHGKSLDTSMGLTPVEGLMMGTRCGDLDSGVLLYIQDKERLTTKQMNDLINKRSGLLGVSGISSDMRDLESLVPEGIKRSILALEMFNYRVKKYVGAYAAAMGGVDIILFTGGIGENDYTVREKVCEGLDFMGVKLDKTINTNLRGKDTIVSTDDSPVKVLLVTTDEELVIATDTYNIVQGK
ncbi:acetate kinase [Bacteroidia bacterium]|nr:acetate kinase [Bacteroidia bacterium]